MLQCPKCKKKNKRVIIQLHHTKKHHCFICGNCRTEFPFRKDKIIPINYQLVQNYENISRFEMLEEICRIEEKVNNMSYEEKLTRLKEIDEKKKK